MSPTPSRCPPGHPLWRAPNVLISPHVGGSTSAFLPRAKRLLAAQLTRFVAGEPLANVVLTTGQLTLSQPVRVRPVPATPGRH